MSSRKPVLLLTDIIESAQKIKNYTVGLSYHEFINDDKTKDAVIRNFEIIGEAANRLPHDLKDRFSGVNWQRLRGFRNRIVHDYMGIDYAIIWRIIENDLDELGESITAIIDKV
jgi:uncharacterized protein with HEPN domain